MDLDPGIEAGSTGRPSNNDQTAKCWGFSVLNRTCCVEKSRQEIRFCTLPSGSSSCPSSGRHQVVTLAIIKSAFQLTAGRAPRHLSTSCRRGRQSSIGHWQHPNSGIRHAAPRNWEFRDVATRPACKKRADRSGNLSSGIDKEVRCVDPAVARLNSQLKPPYFDAGKGETWAQFRHKRICVFVNR